MNTIWQSLSYRARSDEEDDWEDEDDGKYADLAKLSEDDQPGWVMDTISIMVQYHISRFRQKQLRGDKLTQRGWGEAAD
jgi:hypothetical protein